MQKRLGPYLILGAALFAFIQTFSLLSPILFSFLMILLISLAVNPVISRMRVLKAGRKSATGLIVSALVVVIALTGWAFFGPMNVAITKLSERLPAYWERLQKPLIKMEQQAVLSEEKLQTEVTTEIARTATDDVKPEAARQIIKPAPPKMTKESESIRSRLSQMIQGVVGSFTAVAFNTIFLTVPERHHEQTLTILQRVGRFVPTWAFATLLAMLTVGVLVFLLMCLFFGILDALVLGVIAGLLEAIPYLGPILSAVPALLFAMGEGGMVPLWVLLAYLAVQVIENNVICPLIMARSMKLHPVAVIFSMLLCVAAFGVLGVLLAAPLVAVVNIVHDELYRKRFLPTVTDADLERLSQMALREKD
jgi:predicted PurR-regulated permease PerM